MRHALRVALSAVLTVAVLAVPIASMAGKTISNGKLPPNYLKFEEEEIGLEGCCKTWNGISVTLSNWVEKEDGECIGFTCTVQGGSVSYYMVKCGPETVVGSDEIWLDPNGVSAQSISHIVFVLDENAGSIASAPKETRNAESWAGIKALYR